MILIKKKLEKRKKKDKRLAKCHTGTPELRPSLSTNWGPLELLKPDRATLFASVRSGFWTLLRTRNEVAKWTRVGT